MIVRHADRVKKKVTALERDVIVRSLRHYIISLLQSTAYRFYIAQCVEVIIKCKAMNIKRFDFVFFCPNYPSCKSNRCGAVLCLDRNIFIWRIMLVS